MWPHLPEPQVRVESTGEYWKPIFNLLEGVLEVILVNAQHLKTVPGRKTDVKDSEWIAELLQYGLLRASFTRAQHALGAGIPPVAQRELRDLTRYRGTFIRERVNLINRVQKLLEDANIKLASVASNVTPAPPSGAGGQVRARHAGGHGSRHNGPRAAGQFGQGALAHQAG